MGGGEEKGMEVRGHFQVLFLRSHSPCVLRQALSLGFGVNWLGRAAWLVTPVVRARYTSVCMPLYMTFQVSAGVSEVRTSLLTKALPPGVDFQPFLSYPRAES